LIAALDIISTSIVYNMNDLFRFILEMKLMENF
jgi:hypothetical protein